MPYEHLDSIEKTPHLFNVTLKERALSVDASINRGKYYTKFCDGVAVNVYGFKDQAQADAFDPIKLRGYLISQRTRSFLWEAESRAILLIKITEDKDIKNGSMRLAKDEEVPSKTAIESYPECERMHTNKKTGETLCGKPTSEYGDGCMGGCVVQGYNQEFNPEFLVCPLQKFWNERFQNRETAVHQ